MSNMGLGRQGSEMNAENLNLTIKDIVSMYKIHKQYSKEFLDREITKEIIQDIQALHGLSVEEILDCLSQFNINSDIIVKGIKVKNGLYWYFDDQVDKKFKPIIKYIWVSWINYSSPDDIKTWFENTVPKNNQGRSDFSKRTHMD